MEKSRRDVANQGNKRKEKLYELDFDIHIFHVCRTFIHHKQKEDHSVFRFFSCLGSDNVL